MDDTTDVMSKCVYEMTRRKGHPAYPVILLSVGHIQNIYNPRSQKLSVGVLFSLGGICMLTSILRVVRVGNTTGASNS